MKLSIDMLNLHFVIPVTVKDCIFPDFEINIQSQLQIILDKPEVKYWQSFKHSDYRHNATWELGDSSLYIGLQHNSKKPNNYVDMKLEYNPNKLSIPPELQFIIGYAKTFKIKSFDLAVDIPENMDKITFLEGRKQINYYKGTYYIGERKNGIKIYDKALEQGIKGNLTRIEYRVPIDSINTNLADLKGIRYPDIVYMRGIDELPARYGLMMAGLQGQPEYFQRLSIKERKTLKKATESLDRIAFSGLIEETQLLLNSSLSNINM